MERNILSGCVATILAVTLTVFHENIECSRSHQTETFVTMNAWFAHKCTASEVTPFTMNCEQFYSNKYINANDAIKLPFWRVFRHIVGRTPGKWPSSPTCLQSVIDRVLLSKGSAHFGSESDRHSQHLIASPVLLKPRRWKYENANAPRCPQQQVAAAPKNKHFSYHFERKSKALKGRLWPRCSTVHSLLRLFRDKVLGKRTEYQTNLMLFDTCCCYIFNCYVKLFVRASVVGRNSGGDCSSVIIWPRPLLSALLVRRNVSKAADGIKVERHNIKNLMTEPP